MSLVYIILVLIIVGVLLQIINSYIPMAPPIKTIINLLVIIAVVLWVLQALGIVNLMSYKLT